MPSYEVVHDGEQWRILTHHSASWLERSGPLQAEEEARLVVQGLRESQGLEHDPADLVEDAS